MEQKKFLGIPVVGTGLFLLPKGKIVGKYRVNIWINDVLGYLRSSKRIGHTLRGKLVTVSKLLFTWRISKGYQYRFTFCGLTFELVLDTDRTRTPNILDKMKSEAKKINPAWDAQHYPHATGYRIVEENGYGIAEASYDDSLKKDFSWEKILGWK